MRSPRRPLSWYREQPLATRLHVALRWATCPFGVLEAELPAEGSILDWGCGHGLLATWAAHRSPSRSIIGVDIDADKLVAARAAAHAAGIDDRTSFTAIRADELPTGSWPAVVINDVLYLLSHDQQERLVSAGAHAVQPGGLLLAKVMGEQPQWKVRATEAQETVAVRLIGITDSDEGVHESPPVDHVVAWMDQAGLDVSLRRVDRGYHCPHVLIVGRRPG